jgi:hypothetical protein
MSQRAWLFITSGVQQFLLRHRSSRLWDRRLLPGNSVSTWVVSAGWGSLSSQHISCAPAGFIQLYNCSLIDKIVERFNGWGCRWASESVWWAEMEHQANALCCRFIPESVMYASISAIYSSYFPERNITMILIRNWRRQNLCRPELRP